MFLLYTYFFSIWESKYYSQIWIEAVQAMQYLGTSSNVVSGGISNVNRENFPTRFQYSANKQYTRIV